MNYNKTNNSDSLHAIFFSASAEYSDKSHSQRYIHTHALNIYTVIVFVRFHCATVREEPLSFRKDREAGDFRQ